MLSLVCFLAYLPALPVYYCSPFLARLNFSWGSPGHIYFLVHKLSD